MLVDMVITVVSVGRTQIRIEAAIAAGIRKGDKITIDGHYRTIKDNILHLEDKRKEDWYDLTAE